MASRQDTSTGGSLAELLGPPVPQRELSLSAATWTKIAVLAALLVLLHFAELSVMVRTWLARDNWTHGFIIPLFSLYLLYMRRHDLAAAPRRTGALGLAGLAIMLIALAAEIYGTFGLRVNWFVQMWMVAMLFGLVLYLAGPAVIRVTWLPILYLVFALPIPDALYSRVALPLQNLSAKGAVMMLRLLGVDLSSAASRLDVVSRSGQSHSLTVAEACSGMQLLMAFLALGVAMAYLDDKPIWQRVILVAAAIPIAIFCNVLRVAITCFMYYIDKPDLGKGFMHTATGMLMLIPAFLLLWLLAWILKILFVEVDEDETAKPAGNGGAA